MMNTGRGPGWTLEHNKVGLRPGRGLGGYEDTINSLIYPLTKTEESLAVFLVLQLLLATDTTCRQHCHVTQTADRYTCKHGLQTADRYTCKTLLLQVIYY